MGIGLGLGSGNKVDGRTNLLARADARAGCVSPRAINGCQPRLKAWLHLSLSTPPPNNATRLANCAVADLERHIFERHIAQVLGLGDLG